MRRLDAALGSAAFFVIAPGSATLLLPWLITRFAFRPAFLGLEWLRWLGAAIIALGAAPLVASFVRFALEGLGTPAPIAPPMRLVVSGTYAHVRNPMYVAALTVLAGETLLFADLRLLALAAVFWLAAHLFVVLYEEPTLGKKFGAEYDTYRANVPRWVPRVKGWKGGEEP